MDLISQYNKRLFAKYLPVAKSGCRRFDFLGGRRSGKSYLIEQILLGRVLRFGEVVNVAVMTSEQGRLGVYSDVCDIVAGSPTMQPYVDILKSPRQLNCKNGGRMFFNSYQDPERAKGIACDWLYINEANNFTERQYIDLSASVRKGVFADRNPNTKCWTETNGFTLIHSTWQDNDYLTDEQLRWFATLKEKAEAENATAADKYFYRVYYLGEYAELAGSIFTPDKMQRVAVIPSLRFPLVYCDPSSLRNGDYFACVLSGVGDDGKIYVVDTYSPNTGGWDDVISQLRTWAKDYKDIKIYVETNGYVGGEFYRYAQKALPVQYYVSTQNKYERILGNYENLTGRMVYNDTERVTDFLQQVYTFEKGCKHDDNADALDATFRVHRYFRHID